MIKLPFYQGGIMNNFLLFVYGFTMAIVFIKLFDLNSNNGIAHGICPFCEKDVDVKYSIMYECPECKKRYTDDEAREQAYLNDQRYEEEKEYEFKRMHDEQRKQDYKDALEKLKDEYSDIRR
jgi:hypothetical protein